MIEKRVSIAVCPKCESNDLYLTEIWCGHYIVFDQEEGIIEENNGSLEMGDPFKVEGLCKKCKHGWLFKDVHQIGYLLKDDINVD
jgi:RNA polymerase subunit RPABC4/transcription elongation factor Spt4